MKLIIYFLLCISVINTGCKEESGISTEDLARALRVNQITIRTPHDSQKITEKYFFKIESDRGRTEWSYAFTTPNENDRVRFLIDRKANSLTILSGDKIEKITLLPDYEFYNLDSYDVAIEIETQDFLIIHSNSMYAEELSRGAVFGDERDDEKWTTFRLVAASEIPDDAPQYIHQIISKK